MDDMKCAVEAQLKETMSAMDRVAADAPLIAEMGARIIETYKKGGKLIVFGNGGSAADSQHFVCEMSGRFLKDRAPLPAVALSTNTSSVTAIGNDYGYDEVFVRQLEGLGAEGDVAVAISTSGNSPNVLKAVEAAKKKGITVIGLAGETGGKLKPLCDLCLCAPGKLSPRIQEVHITVIHILCGLVEEALFPK